MKDFRRILLCFFSVLVLTLFQTLAYAGMGSPYDRIIFFGDSLTDNGNLYWYDFGYMPKSPPYFEGRFTNGYVWADKVAQYFADNNVVSKNYALGGQTAILHDPMNGYLPVSLSMAINTYLLRSGLSDRSSSLYIIWIGCNDYLRGTDDKEGLSDLVVESIKYNLEKLIYHGGMNFLIVNIPDMSKTPYGLQNEVGELLGELTVLHNKKLKSAIKELQQSYKGINIRLFDANSLFQELLSSSNANIGKKDKGEFGVIKNKTDACWEGGYTFRAITNKNLTIEKEIENYLQTHSKYLTGTVRKDFSSRDTAQMIVSSPDLAEAYSVTNLAAQGGRPCSNPDEYIFWDKLHPTAVIHSLFAERIIDYVNKNYEPAL